MQRNLASINILILLMFFSGHCVAQSCYPDSVGQKKKYEVTIDTGKSYVSGICFLVNNGEQLDASLFNDFGISILDFTYRPTKDKVKLCSVMSFLNKWYIRKVLKTDLLFVLKNLKSGHTEYRNNKRNIDYKFKVLEDDTEE